MPTTSSQNAAPERLPAVILFAETRGFTRMSQILAPDVVLARASEFFMLVREVIERHGGIVRNVLNDTLMASFSGDKRAANAVQAAQDIQIEFTFFEETWEQEYGIHAAVAIGLHEGDAVFGTDETLPGESLVIGDSVSIAERLLHRARAGEFVLSKSVMDALATESVALGATELPALQLSRREPIRLFGVLRDTRLDFTDTVVLHVGTS